MKQLLIAVLVFTSLSGFAQYIQAPVRLSYVGSSQIRIVGADGKRQLLPIAQFNFTRSGGDIAIGFGSSVVTVTPAQFLNAAGTPFGGSYDTALDAFESSAPTGTGGGASTATFGTAPSVPTSYTGASGTISTTGTIDILIENTGAANGTMTYGGIVYALATGDQRSLTARLDPTSGKLVPYAVLSVNATGTTIIVTKTPAQ